MSVSFLVPLMLAVLRERVAAGEEDDAAMGFEIFDDMVEFVRPCL
jgi:hypothetical protein